MGISGLIGAGAAQGLEELLARQLLEAQQAERERATRAQEGLTIRRLDQDASQHGDLMGLRGRELDMRESQFDAETEQQSLDALRQSSKDTDSRLTRLTKEDETQSLLDELTRIPGLSQAQMAAARAAITSGRGVDPDNLVTEEQRQLRRKEARDDEIAVIRAREQAQRDFTEKDPTKGASGTMTDAAAVENANEVARLAASLKSHPGFKAVFGSIDGMLPSVRQDSVNAEAIRDRLISSLTLENIGKLKGVLSDRDMQVLREAATSLRPRMGDAAAAAELDRIIGAMNRRGGATPMPSHGGGTAPRRIRFDAKGNRLPE